VFITVLFNNYMLYKYIPITLPSECSDTAKNMGTRRRETN